MQDSTQTGAAPPDDATPKAGGIPIRLSPSGITVGLHFLSGAAGNRTRLKNPTDLRKRRNRVRETTPNDAK